MKKLILTVFWLLLITVITCLYSEAIERSIQIPVILAQIVVPQEQQSVNEYFCLDSSLATFLENVSSVLEKRSAQGIDCSQEYKALNDFCTALSEHNYVKAARPDAPIIPEPLIIPHALETIRDIELRDVVVDTLVLDFAQTLTTIEETCLIFKESNGFIKGYICTPTSFNDKGLFFSLDGKEQNMRVTTQGDTALSRILELKATNSTATTGAILFGTTIFLHGGFAGSNQEVALGKNTLQKLPNTAAVGIGFNALQNLVATSTQQRSVAVGTRAFASQSMDFNFPGTISSVACGTDALATMTVVGLGENAVFGSQAAMNSNNRQNVMMGYNAGKNPSSTGNLDVVCGSQAGTTVGQTCVEIGYRAASAKPFSNLVAVGSQVMDNSLTDAVDGVVAFGAGALQSGPMTANIAAVGTRALKNVTTGALLIAFGVDALQGATGSSGRLVACGARAAFNANSNNSASNIVALGSEALLNLTTAIQTFGAGARAQRNNRTAGMNLALGVEALYSVTSGSTQNIAIGTQASYNMTSTANGATTAVGYQALFTNTSSINTIGIGYKADVGSGVVNNSIALGANAVVTTSVTLVLGNNTVNAVLPGSDLNCNLGWSNRRWRQLFAQNGTLQTSDRKLKSHIHPSTCGLEFIRSLTPLSYTMFGEDHHGLGAQSVKALLDKHDIKDFGGYLYDSQTDSHMLNYMEFIAPLVKALQELNDVCDNLETYYVTALQTSEMTIPVSIALKAPRLDAPIIPQQLMLDNALEDVRDFELRNLYLTGSLTTNNLVVDGITIQSTTSGACLVFTQTDGSFKAAICSSPVSGERGLFITSDGTTQNLLVTASCDVTLTGSLLLPATTQERGQIVMNEVPFLHAYGTDNTWAGNGAGNFGVTGSQNTACGYNALQAVTSGQGNIAVGYTTLMSLTAGLYNTALGGLILSPARYANNNTVIGGTVFGIDSSAQDSVYDSNVAVGAGIVLTPTTSVMESVFLGRYTGRVFGGGIGNTLLGAHALQSTAGLTVQGDYTTAVGFQSLFNNAAPASFTINNGTMAGVNSGYFLTTGQQNTGCGRNAFFKNSAPLNGLKTGNRNTALGTSNLLCSPTIDDNIAIGQGLLNVSVNDYQKNTIVGSSIGSTASYAGTGNVMLALVAAAGLTTGNSNTNINSTLTVITSAAENVAVGATSLNTLTTGSANTACGFQSFGTGSSLTTGSFCTAVGFQATSGSTNAFNTTVIGAVCSVPTGSDNTIAFGSTTAAQTLSRIISGSDAFCSLGNASRRWRTIFSSNGVINTSDIRYKTDIKKLEHGLNFIKDLLPSVYMLNKEWHHGFIAQEVKTVLEKWNMPKYSLYRESENTCGLHYEQFIPFIINAIKDLQQRCVVLKMLHAKLSDMKVQRKSL